jgi:hypothetical protein
MQLLLAARMRFCANVSTNLQTQTGFAKRKKRSDHNAVSQRIQVFFAKVKIQNVGFN